MGAQRPVAEVAQSLGLPAGSWWPWGRDKAKISLEVLAQPRDAALAPGRVVLVSAMTPTPRGEGKTTTSVGLAQGMARRGAAVCLALREPSLGPCMGMKGGGTGGGRSRLEPSDDINLHFTGDMHAVSAAHNLLAAVLDNHLHFGNALGLDPRRVTWGRVLDMNDRALRRVVVGLGGPTQGVPRESGFDITPASEIMAILGLCSGEEDAKARLGRILVGVSGAGEPVYAAALEAHGAMAALLRDALMPNLVQSTEGVPALVHGGPFANIAHGCSSALATRMGLHLAEWVVTEAGFGFDLGGEKFLDIKCRLAGLPAPAAVVVVATLRALEHHGQDAGVQAGLANLEAHLDAVARFGLPAVVALNRFDGDAEDDIAAVARWCAARGTPFAASEHFQRGGEGAEDLADAVMAAASPRPAPLRTLYPLEAPLEDKLQALAEQVYGAGEVVWSPQARKERERLERWGLGALPVCVAKTHSSLSDNPALLGRPRGFPLRVERLEVNAGAGFIVALTGDILRMPGLPRVPQAAQIDLRDGQIVGLQ